MPTGNLLVVKDRRLWLALAWTCVIMFLSLVSFKAIPSKISVVNADKLVHVIFHFTFTILWYLYSVRRFQSRKSTNILSLIVIASFLFGICIEIAQELLTTYREADLADIIANLTGATIAAVYLSIMARRKIKPQ